MLVLSRIKYSKMSLTKIQNTISSSHKASKEPLELSHTVFN